MSTIVLNACQVQATHATPVTNPVSTPSMEPQTPAQTQTVEAPSTQLIPPTSCPTASPDELSLFNARSITAADNGKALVVHQTDRFSVYLDDRLYPLNDLRAVPAGALGLISNGSVRGPNCYPIMFEAVTEGDAYLSDRGFRLRVVVDNNAPVSPSPLH